MSHFFSFSCFFFDPRTAHFFLEPENSQITKAMFLNTPKPLWATKLCFAGWQRHKCGNFLPGHIVLWLVGLIYKWAFFLSTWVRVPSWTQGSEQRTVPPPNRNWAPCPRDMPVVAAPARSYAVEQGIGLALELDGSEFMQPIVDTRHGALRQARVGFGGCCLCFPQQMAFFLEPFTAKIGPIRNLLSFFCKFYS